MPGAVEHSSDLNRAEAALIGRCVASFGYLESELAALVICLHATCPNLPSRSPKLGRLLKAGLGKMNQFLREHFSEYLETGSSKATEVAANLEDLLNTSRDLRNWICHGSWSSDRAETLCCAFWSEAAREALGDERQEIVEPETLQFSYSDLQSISDMATSMADELKTLRLSIQASTTVPDQ